MIGHRNDMGLGNLTSLKPIATTTTTTTNNNNNNEIEDDVVEDDSTTNNTTYCTKIIRITPETFELLKFHSHKYHDQPISYDEIIEELCTFYNENHETKYFHLTSY